MQFLKASLFSFFLLVSCSESGSTPENLEEPASGGGGIVITVGNGSIGAVQRDLFVENIEDAINATGKLS